MTLEGIEGELNMGTEESPEGRRGRMSEVNELVEGYME